MDRSRIKYPWDSLKAAGDSFETVTPVTKYMRANITNYAKRKGYNVVTRFLDDGRLKVWRIS